ncbi:hypothetical protein BZG36_02919 [Bifiguratus adelaidae]|uniref:FAD dependent oxidoreductase domain-containing protein n=1 Tax=Bifiguratus adelaidae TaxID=1938954 RepID=A0A261Y1B6_9FUNG|nr:hypothetical protein BZG36_02919 [Bifiguratus adelaidae]
MTACFPVAHPLPSLWLEGNPFEDYRSTPELPTHADIVVVGTGLSGSSTVLELSKTPNLSVLVLEARGASSGATGRNGGHLTPLSFRDYRLDCQLHGQAYALAVRDFEMQNYQELRTLIDTEDIQCHFQNDSGNVQLYCDVDAYQEALEDLRVWKADGGNAAGVQVLDAEKAKQMSPLAVGAIRIPASQLTPPVFCWHILQQALRNPKINLQTHTPVTGIDPVNHSETCGPWTIKTPRGTVTASKVILCTNGWSRHFNLVDIVPVRAQVTAYQNLPEIEQHEHFGFSAHHGAEYMHERAFDHTVVLGGARDKVPGQEIGVWNDAEINPRVAQGLDDYLASHFPRMCQRSSSLLLPVRKRWTGIMGYTASGRPYIGETKNESNVYICAGFK